MAFLNSLNISGSALTAQKFRMEVISQNIANAESTADGKAYRRKLVVLSERQNSFAESFKNASQKIKTENSGGVEVSGIVEDDNAVRLEYDPDNPLANDEGYVEKPDINTLEEMIDMMSASRAYEANVTTFNAVKSMAMKALEIGK
jgi:flagellar basal-body rod protein FlgC